MDSRPITPGPHLEVDFSRSPVLVKVDGEVLEGVTRATVDVEPTELVVLTLRVIRFDLIGGELPDLRMRPHERHTQD